MGFSINLEGGDSYKDKVFDVVIVGGGPAGLTAGIYAQRAGLSSLIIEKLAPGGQAINTYHIENYPGFPEGISGSDLMNKFTEQAEKFGTEITYDEIEDIRKEGDLFKIKGMEGEYQAKTVIISTGAEPRKLNVKGEREYTGKGVSYCAVCDGALFKDKVVCVVGGGDAALEEAEYLTKHAKTVYIIHRRDKFRAQKFIQDRVLAIDKIKPIYNKVVKEIKGGQFVEEVILEDTKTGEIMSLPVDGVFVYIGVDPQTDFLKAVELGEDRGIKINEKMMTNIEGIFAAGDCVENAPKQVITAAADGAKAAMYAYEYIVTKGL